MRRTVDAILILVCLAALTVGCNESGGEAYNCPAGEQGCACLEGEIPCRGDSLF